MSVENIPVLVQELYAIVSKLEEYFPGRRFTPDGHLVGSIGEVLAAYHYGLDLLPASSKGHDATSRAGVMVQIKATQGKTVALRSEPQHLLVLKLLQSGEWEEVYNGPGALAWNRCGKMQKNGQRPIGTSKLATLMIEIDAEDRLPRVTM